MTAMALTKSKANPTSKKKLLKRSQPSHEESTAPKVKKPKVAITDASEHGPKIKAKKPKKVVPEKSKLKNSKKELIKVKTVKTLTNEEKREVKEKKKKLKEERQKKSKTSEVFEMGQEAKRIWEELRREDCPQQKKQELVVKLYERLKGKLLKLIMAHDTVRVLECLISQSPPEMKLQMFNEVKDNLIGITKSKYGHYFVVKLLKYGDKNQRQAIFKVLETRVAELMKHKIANNVVETFYNEYANAKQRNRMLQEFCGPEFRVFKEEDIRTVKQLIEKHPEKERDIVKNLGVNVSTLITKGCYNHSIVHSVIYNYLQVCSTQSRTETISSLHDVCVHILHSHDGARVTMECFWHGTAKDRKAIIKSFKTYVAKICSESHGYLVMMAMFDSVDDTKIVSKAILNEVSANMNDIASSEHGRKMLMYLLAWRNTTYFHPDIIALLKQGDGNQHSKKDPEIRQSELRAAISPAVCRYALENLNELFKANSTTIFLTCVLNFADDSGPLLMALAEECCKPFAKGDNEDNLVENPATHMMLKKVIARDKFRQEKGAKLFSESLLDNLDEDTIECWLECNRGCFLFVNIWDTEIEELRQTLKAKLAHYNKMMKAQKTKGAEILRKKLC